MQRERARRALALPQRIRVLPVSEGINEGRFVDLAQ